MFVDVQFKAAPPAGAVVIPRSALRPNDQVWVIGQDHHLEIRHVQVARAGIEQAVISGGLAAGERICISNLQYVVEGMPVRVEGEAAAPENKPGKGARKDGEG
jgi:multidrug efflux pump subunit AcrA (membrane-fusion protein)